MKPIHKFNNGRGAMLCNICRTIISTGPTTKELYCNRCLNELNLVEEEYNLWKSKLEKNLGPALEKFREAMEEYYSQNTNNK
jgi:reverse gyrase